MRWPRFWVRCSFIGLTGLLPTAPAPAQVVTMLHAFQGGANDGRLPQGSLVVSGTVLYGMTENGGASNDGTVFSVGISGTGFGLLRSLSGGVADAQNPLGSLILSGSTLFGLAEAGGSANEGVAFAIGTNGAGFNLTHSFGGGPADGALPFGSLAQSGNSLYGFTSSGGSIINNTSGHYSNGAVFTVNTNGTGESLLHSFGGANDGRMPFYGAPAVSGNTLYGTTVSDVNTNTGIVFKIGTDGTGYTILHRFGGSVGGDGAGPGQPILAGTTLYGMTGAGGTANDGTIYKINTDGTGYTVLHSFTGAANDGSGPAGELTLVGSTLYGMTSGGGADALGTIFGINTDGSGYEVLHSFAGGPNDGAGPGADLVLSGSTFFGTTIQGGANNDGTVFSFTVVPEPSSLLLVAAGGAAIYLRRQIWRRRNKSS